MTLEKEKKQLMDRLSKLYEQKKFEEASLCLINIMHLQKLINEEEND